MSRNIILRKYCQKTWYLRDVEEGEGLNLLFYSFFRVDFPLWVNFQACLLSKPICFLLCLLYAFVLSTPVCYPNAPDMMMSSDFQYRVGFPLFSITSYMFYSFPTLYLCALIIPCLLCNCTISGSVYVRFVLTTVYCLELDIYSVCTEHCVLPLAGYIRFVLTTIYCL